MPKGIAGNARGQGPRSKIALADTKLFGIEEGLEETKRLTRIADKFEAPRPENVEEKVRLISIVLYCFLLSSLLENLILIFPLWPLYTIHYTLFLLIHDH